MDNVTDEEVVWKTYPDYPFIEVDQFSEVRTKDRWVPCNSGKRLIKGRVLKQSRDKDGYMEVHFRMHYKQVHLRVHRAVATCFIPNPNNYPEVNHIDCDRTNNRWNNLEWCTSQYNTAYRERYGKSAAEVHGRPVIAINPERSEVLWFETQAGAGRELNVYASHITDVVRDKRHKTGGCWFCYADENAVKKTRAKFGEEIANKVEKLINENNKNITNTRK